ADNKNTDAMFYLGDFYLNGKFKAKKNIGLGLSYLYLAASYKHKRAINLIKESGYKSIPDQETEDEENDKMEIN
ncbi:32180_t:CDS:2, partial [Racocetra persica]